MKHACILDKVTFNIWSVNLEEAMCSPSFSWTLNSLMTFSAAQEIIYLIIYSPKCTSGAENIYVRVRQRDVKHLLS